MVKKIEEENTLKNNGGLKFSERPMILLVDEVDVILGDSFFAAMYSPTTNIKGPEVSKLLDYVWS